MDINPKMILFIEDLQKIPFTLLDIYLSTENLLRGHPLEKASKDMFLYKNTKYNIYNIRL